MGTTKQLDDYIQIVAKPKRPITGHTAAFPSTVYNHVSGGEDSKTNNKEGPASTPSQQQLNKETAVRPLSANS